MNAFVRKEVRLLLPTFLIGLLLALSIWLLPQNPARASAVQATLGILMLVLSPVLLVMMTLAPFGRELSSGTFSNLLVQPVLRARIWWTKTSLLAVASALLWAVWWCSLAHNHTFRMISTEDQYEAFLTTLLFVGAAYSGGLWTVLLFRQVAAAFWFTLLTPAMIMMGVAQFFDGYHATDPEKFRRILTLAFATYSVGGFLFARHLFLRAQDVQWTGGVIALPSWRARRKPVDVPRRKHRFHPRATLLAKEFQLHQSQFVLAGVLLLLHLGVLALRRFAKLQNSPVLEFLTEAFWVLWLVLPLLVGCAAVAEERKLGTLESQLCLPARRRTQFIFKFVIALTLSVLLGAVMPLLLEGTRILPGFQLEFSNYARTARTGGLVPLEVLVAVGGALPFLILAAIAAAIGTVALYASTLSRNTLQCLAPAVLGLVVVGFSIFLAANGELFGHELWRGWLIYLLGVPVMTGSLVALMYWNFKRVHVGGNVWRRNALVLLLSFGFVTVATATIYHRAWEVFTLAEPPRGPAQLTSAATLRSDGNTAMVQLTNGRVWTIHLPFFPPVFAPHASRHGGYIEGTDWMHVEKCNQDFVGLRRDGSLWVLSWPETFARSNSAVSARVSPPWTRVGSENDWTGVVASASQALLLKTDGTLWRLGTNGLPGPRPGPGLGAFTPQRLGRDSDWAEIFPSASGRTTLRKRDGSVWIGPPLSLEDDKLELAPGRTVYRAPYFDAYKSTAELLGGMGLFCVGIRDDGTFRLAAASGYLPPTENNRRVRPGMLGVDVALDSETNWVALAGNLDHMVTLRSDGTLWRWVFLEHSRNTPASATPVSFSKHSDWVAIAPALTGIVALAADGSVWLLELEPGRFSAHPNQLLRTSRRPRLIGNVFAAN